MRQLPAGYTRLTHIESTGTQFVDTGYAWSSESVRLEIGFELISAKNNSLFGSQPVSTTGYGLIPHVPSGSSQIVFYVGTSGNMLPTTVAFNQRYDMICATKNNILAVSLNGVEQTAAYNGSVITGSTNTLFANHVGTAIKEQSEMVVSYYRMYDNDVLVRDYEPCISESGEVGLYDYVYGTFYGNAGTGVFIAGDQYVEKSLGMSFARRRLALAKKDPKYVWRVYNVTDQWEAGWEDDFSLSSSRYKMASSSFYVNAAGNFVLADPVQTTAANLKVGDYVVDCSTSSSTKTNAINIWQIKTITRSGTTYRFTTAGYDSDCLSKVQGDTLLFEVESDTPDYPVDGEQDGLWYVMIKGEYTMYVWTLYNVEYEKVYKEQRTSGATTWCAAGYGATGVSYSTLYAGNTYNFSPSEGTFAVRNQSGTSNTGGTNLQITPTVTDATIRSFISGKYWYWANSTRHGQMYYSVSSVTTGAGQWGGQPRRNFSGMTLYSGVVDTSQQGDPYRGSSTGNTVEHYDISKYPTNNYIGDIWYVNTGNYLYVFDNR